MSLYLFDNEIIRTHGVSALCGVDEVGRGPLAGDVYAAAVILNPEQEIAGLNDSKKLSEKKREALYEQIIASARAYSIATASIEEIDTYNILQAALLAMRRAVAALPIPPDYLLVDGNKDPQADVPTQLVVSGDAKSACIAAASIVAKVERDRYMLELDKEYPAYCFAKHKGYGTKLHYEMLAEHGVSPVHRQSFLVKWRKGRGDA